MRMSRGAAGIVLRHPHQPSFLECLTDNLAGARSDDAPGSFASSWQLCSSATACHSTLVGPTVVGPTGCPIRIRYTDSVHVALSYDIFSYLSCMPQHRSVRAELACFRPRQNHELPSLFEKVPFPASFSRFALESCRNFTALHTLADRSPHGRRTRQRRITGGLRTRINTQTARQP